MYSITHFSYLFKFNKIILKKLYSLAYIIISFFLFGIKEFLEEYLQIKKSLLIAI